MTVTIHGTGWSPTSHPYYATGPASQITATFWWIMPDGAAAGQNDFYELTPVQPDGTFTLTTVVSAYDYELPLHLTASIDYWDSNSGTASLAGIQLPFDLLAPATTPKPKPKPNYVAEACMVYARGTQLFNAGPIHINVGHVGWIITTNQSAPLFEYGANEGPLGASRQHRSFNWTSRTWVRTSNWATVKKAFRSSKDHYESFRCRGVTKPNVHAAQAVISREQGSTYTIPDNDCLSYAVDVLRAYGVPGLPNPRRRLFNRAPSLYYRYDLPGFGPVQKL
ncbi:MAG: hypothetical protein JO168_22275 [Solirubrobacterales bacterium]|nr:hypothetical protein [Solirubrobacterales bacterium]